MFEKVSTFISMNIENLKDENTKAAIKAGSFKAAQAVAKARQENRFLSLAPTIAMRSGRSRWSSDSVLSGMSYVAPELALIGGFPSVGPVPWTSCSFGST